MTVFVDTSALIALIDQGAARHAAVTDAFRELLATASLVTHLGILQETVAVARRRYGYKAARMLLLAAGTDLDIHPLDIEAHREATAAFTAAPTRISFTDLLSFAFMRRMSVQTALVLDRDFERAGFTCLPA